jgi:hypothetical protein
MTEEQIALLGIILEIGYASMVQEFPGLPKEEWVEEVVATYQSDRDFWLAANPGGTMEEFVETVPAQKHNPLREAAENVMRRHRR